ncbi:MAG: hypothetical protein JSR36_15285 [Proteobacteria bacterium]|nr:hypothetical protein [Pseudomonadota bacterium]
MRIENSERVLQLLLTAPRGLRAVEIMQHIRPKVSQPTLWRVLDKLRSQGRVVVDGFARATRYHATERADLAALRSLRMHEVVAKRLINDPELLSIARDRLQRLRNVNPHGGTYHKRWEELINGPMDRLLRMLTEPSEEAATLRQESPFTTLVPSEERCRVFEALRTAA